MTIPGFLFIGVLTAVTLAGCSSSISEADRAAAKRGGTAISVQTAVPPALAVANLSYSEIYAETVTLANGRWEGKPFVQGGAARPVVGLVENFTFPGDLDGDGNDEIVVFLWENSGGSGTNIYLAIVGLRDGKNVNLTTARLGDRVQLRGGRIHNARIVLDVVQQGAEDAACCPSQLARRSWILAAGELQEEPVITGGTLSLAELAGEEWLLTELQTGKPVPAGMKTTLMLDADRISGASSCNRYFASVSPGKIPGDMTISGTGSTRMACPPALMNFESDFLDALSKVTRYGFLNGQLAFTWQQDGQAYTMLFSGSSR